ncbi:hypothetical protein JNUCC42_06055 [Brevibacterium sp. JNUCC-42]|nr:hypothetical protein JNUCC42_06055 [Brevibacterium sp. JNUCC-42]
MRFDESNEASAKAEKEGLAVELQYEQATKNIVPACQKLAIHCGWR